MSNFKAASAGAGRDVFAIDYSVKEIYEGFD